MFNHRHEFIRKSGLFKIISILLIATFVALDIAWAQEIGSFKLSPPSSFSNMKGPEFKEAAQIQVGVRIALKDLQGFDIDAIKALGQRQFTEKTVFGKPISVLNFRPGGHGRPCF